MNITICLICVYGLLFFGLPTILMGSYLTKEVLKDKHINVLERIWCFICSMMCIVVGVCVVVYCCRTLLDKIIGI